MNTLSTLPSILSNLVIPLTLPGYFIYITQHISPIQLDDCRFTKKIQLPEELLEFLPRIRLTMTLSDNDNASIITLTTM